MVARLDHMSDGRGFGGKHNAAIDGSLRKFFFRSLTSLRTAAEQELLRSNAMECIIWECDLAHTLEDARDQFTARRDR